MEDQKRYTITLDDDATVHKYIARLTGISSLPYTSTSALMARAASYQPVAAFIDIHLGLEESGLDLFASCVKAGLLRQSS